MEEFFLKIVNMSVNATWLVLAVLLLRLLLKKAPKAIICALWAVVGLRLILPFSFESPVSLVPSAEVFPEEFLYAAEPKIDTGFEALDNILNPVIAESLAPAPGVSANPTQINAIIFPIIWIAGMALMLVYMLISFIRVRYKVREAAPLYENVWACDHIDTPFILGVIRPKIYLPSDMAEGDGVYVLAHEKAHIKRLDYVWKPLGFLVLAVHWFNPVVWAAYVLFCRDIEFACDEKVVKSLGAEKKQEYSTALLNLSAPKHIISACPLAFGEVGVKKRIKSVLNYKKPAFWVILVALVLAVAAVVAFFAGPKGLSFNQDVSMFLESQVAAHELKVDYNSSGEVDIAYLGSKKSGTATTFYVFAYYEVNGYEFGSDYVDVSLGTSNHIPVIITIEYDGVYYNCIEYLSPENEETNEDFIKEHFPFYLKGVSAYSNIYLNMQQRAVREDVYKAKGFNNYEIVIHPDNPENAMKKEDIIERIAFDYDGDGKEEIFEMRKLGYTGWFRLYVYELDENRIDTAAFDSVLMWQSFEFVLKDEKVYIKGVQEDGSIHFWKIIVPEDKVILSPPYKGISLYETEEVFGLES